MADKQIDPRIYIPPVDGYKYPDTTGSETPGNAEFADLIDIPVSMPAGLQPPSTITVVDQVFRKGADGRTVVDLIIEVPDMPGATEYEIRTSVL